MLVVLIVAVVDVVVVQMHSQQYQVQIQRLVVLEVVAVVQNQRKKADLVHFVHQIQNQMMVAMMHQMEVDWIP